MKRQPPCLVVHGDVTAVGFDEPAGDGEAEPGAAVRPGVRAASPR